MNTLDSEDTLCIEEQSSAQVKEEIQANKDNLYITIDENSVKVELNLEKIFHILHQYMVAEKGGKYFTTSDTTANIVGQYWFLLREDINSPIEQCFIPNEKWEEMILEEQAFNQ
jgi:hypothetical protein